MHFKFNRQDRDGGAEKRKDYRTSTIFAFLADFAVNQLLVSRKKNL
jgi:hypothetical protein